MTRQSESQNPYDVTPYKRRPFPKTHPDRLATIATLLGVAPPPPERCRVLELGCADGGNLLPMADQLPHAEFVGLDGSAVQIAAGRRAVDAIGLTNLELFHRDILDIGRELGEFDYIIAHGVYSWVPPAVQDKILEICATNLRPNGVACVSFNTLPGWRLNGVVRDLMTYRAAAFADPAERVRQARLALEAVGRAAAPNTAYGRVLLDGIENLARREDHYVLHEYLEADNTPVYFREFAGRAAEKGLHYLADGDCRLTADHGLSPDAAAALLGPAPDVIEEEQYADFVRGRMFRVALLCRRKTAVRRPPDPARVAELYVASPVRPTGPPPDLVSNEPAEFRLEGATVSVAEPLLKAVLLSLGEHWPRPIPFTELHTEALSKLGRSPTGPDATSATRDLAESLLFGFGRRTIDLSVRAVPVAADPGPRPAVSRLARYQASAGAEVTNLRHEPVALDPMQRYLMQFLDGTHDRNALLERLLGEVRSGALDLRTDRGAAMDETAARRVLSPLLERSLDGLTKAAMFRPHDGPVPHPAAD